MSYEDVSHKRKFHSFGDPNFYSQSQKKKLKTTEEKETIISPYFYKILNFFPKYISLIIYKYILFTDEELQCVEQIVNESFFRQDERENQIIIQYIDKMFQYSTYLYQDFEPITDMNLWEQKAIHSIMGKRLKLLSFLEFFDININDYLSIRHIRNDVYYIHIHKSLHHVIVRVKSIILTTNVCMEDIISYSSFYSI